MPADRDDLLTRLRLGIYRHYKGPLYQVLGLAHDANADKLLEVRPDGNHSFVRDYEDPAYRYVVVYMPLQLDGAHLGPRMAVRTLEDFFAFVNPRTGMPFNGSGPAVSRFRYLGPELTSEMLGTPPEHRNVTDPRIVYHLLRLVNQDVSYETVTNWTPERLRDAHAWAVATHLSASDNDVVVPPRPGFLP
jgi:hypothetical protein